MVNCNIYYISINYQYYLEMLVKRLDLLISDHPFVIVFITITNLTICGVRYIQSQVTT